ncbi:MAG: hypothetical protein AAF215_24430 [Cyanobacteria bacterium P01_A01_bin.123]
MVINRRLLSVVALAAIALMTLVSYPTASWAADYQGNQAINQPARLVSPEPETEIAIYPKPEPRQRRIGYGIGGDRVTVLEQVGSNQGTTWNHIRFDAPPYAEGWVQEEFVSFQAADSANPGQQVANPTANRGDRYLGDRQSSSDSQGRAQPYSQQDQNQNQNQY